MANQAENNLNQTSAGTVDQAEGNSETSEQTIFHAFYRYIVFVFFLFPF